ncbi:Serine/threonine protein kinase [Saitoella coloradoensis]
MHQFKPASLINRVIDSRLDILDILGIGAYGTVYLAQDLHTSEYLAVKALGHSINNGPYQSKTSMVRELTLQARCSAHPNVVKLHEVLEAGDTTYSVMEMCTEGDLFRAITQTAGTGYPAPDDVRKELFLQVLDAVEYMHTRGIYHRDLKSENIMITDNGATAKIADFGLATTREVSTDRGCGSTFYMSPENVRGDTPYPNDSNDVWSLGVILINILTGRNPWPYACPSQAPYHQYLHDRTFLQSMLPCLSEEICEILYHVLEPEYERRWTVREFRDAILRCGRLSWGDEEVLGSVARKGPRRACGRTRGGEVGYPVYPPITLFPKRPVGGGFGVGAGAGVGMGGEDTGSLVTNESVSPPAVPIQKHRSKRQRYSAVPATKHNGNGVNSTVDDVDHVMECQNFLPPREDESTMNES